MPPCVQIYVVYLVPWQCNSIYCCKVNLFSISPLIHQIQPFLPAFKPKLTRYNITRRHDSPLISLQMAGETSQLNVPFRLQLYKKEQQKCRNHQLDTMRLQTHLLLLSELNFSNKARKTFCFLVLPSYFWLTLHVRGFNFI